MIGVKGSRQPEADTAGSSERYSFLHSEVLSRIPLYIGLIITGIAAYLKTALTPPPAVAGPAPELLPEEEWAMAFQIEPEARKIDNLEDYRQKAEVANLDPRIEPELQNSVRRFTGNVIEFPKPRFFLPDSPLISFEEIPQVSLATPHRFAALPDMSGGSASGGRGGGSDAPALPEGLDDESTPPTEPAKRNRAPEVRGPVRLNDAMTGTMVLIGLSDLLANVTDADGDKLTVKNVRVSSGSIGSDDTFWVYSSNAQAFAGEVTITYEVTDGIATVMQTAIFDIKRGTPIIGTESGDTMLGTLLDDSIEALGGNDLIDARDGNDAIFGGDGDDQIMAGSGNDVVFAGLGNDVVFGGQGNDLISGGEGDDRLAGDAGDDTVLGEVGNDSVSGGAGDDFVSGGEGDDIVSGESGDDLLSGGEGNDQVFDGAGDDRIFGDAGDDVVIIVSQAADPSESDVIDGGDGYDTLDLTQTNFGVAINMATGEVNGFEMGTDTISGIEAVMGGTGDDLFEGGDAAMLFEGGAGDDAVLVSTNGQSDVFAGGEGNDTLDLSSATLDVTIDLESGNVTSLEVGHDVISGFEQVIGGSGNDHFEVGAQAVTLTGGAGDDTFSFAVPLSDIADRPQIIHDIMDFLVGDRVLVQEYELSTRGREDAEDRFQFYYRDMGEEQEELRLRIRYDTEDDQEYTLFEFDYDADRAFELTVAIRGHHEPYLYEHETLA